MIRFIDLGKQIGLDEDWSRQFCFYNTVSGWFVKYCGSQVWDNWDSFEKDFNSDYTVNDDLERFRSLCPEWVFESEDVCKYCGRDLKALGKYVDYIHYKPGTKEVCLELLEELIDERNKGEGKLRKFLAYICDESPLEFDRSRKNWETLRNWIEENG